MPELPEVETVRRAAEERLRGHVVVGLRVADPRLRRPVDVQRVRHVCVGHALSAFGRRGKFLIARFADSGTLVVHLGMSGAFRVVPRDAPLDVHEHVIWHLDDGFDWRFHDPRRFGSIDPLDAGTPEHTHPSLARLGPDPLSSGWRGTVLYGELRNTSRAVKLALLDQHIVAGLGNIYVNEALFKAGVSPFRRADRISLARCERLAEAIRAVLNDALSHGGTSLRDYTRLDGSEGRFALRLRVYGKASLPCPRCAPPQTIRRRMQQNRSTYYCPQCQR